MVGPSRQGLLCLSRRSDERTQDGRLPALRDQALATHATAPQPAARPHLGPDWKAGRRMAPASAKPSPTSTSAVCRQILKVRAGCLNWASPDLCGGRSATAVPTAIRFACIDRGSGRRRSKLRKTNRWQRWVVEVDHVACRRRTVITRDRPTARRDRRRNSNARAIRVWLAWRRRPRVRQWSTGARRPQSRGNPHTNRPFSNGGCRSADIRCVLLDPVASNGDALIGACLVLT